MSLKQAYSMAHTAQCRLQIAAGRPDRDLRFVVGHLMHYEALRLRIVEIEHDISKTERSSLAFQGTGHVGKNAVAPPKSAAGGRRSPPPPVTNYSDSDSDDDSLSGSDGLDDGEDDGLGLERFPSGAARPARPPPELVPDTGDDPDEDADAISLEDPDEATLESALKGDGDADLAKLYNRIRGCECCPQHQAAPVVEKLWELPPEQGQREGITRAVAQVAA